MAKTKISIHSYFPTVLVIDGEQLDVRVRRMGNREFDRFAKQFAEHSAPRGVVEDETAEAKDAREEADREWMREALRTNLTILPGQIEKDGAELADAGDLLDLYGGRIDVVPQALGLVWGENHLSAAQKKTFRSVLGSNLGFTAPPPTAAAGSAPAPTAANAEPSDSAAAAPATGDLPAESSGTTDQIPDTEVLASV